MAVCLYAGIYTTVWQNHDENVSSHYYLGLDVTDIDLERNVFFLSMINFGRWFLVMMNFVSISLLVSLEMVKFVQGKFIEMDWMVYDEEKDMCAKA